VDHSVSPVSPARLELVVVDPVDAAAIAARAGTSAGMVHNWRRRPIGFPDPAVVLAIGPIWRGAEVAAWLADRRAPGRPSKARP
jgi:hypothetical protein